MQPHLTTAIVEFLANEFKLQPASVGEDLSFTSDLGLTRQQVSDLITRLQEALDFTLPEDKIASLDTVEDLLALIDPKTPSEDNP